MKKLFYVFTLMLFTLYSCEKGPMLSISINSINAPADGNSTTIVVNANNPWNVSSNDWCTVSPSSGEGGEVSVTVTVKKNTTYDARNCTLIFTSAGLTQSISVNQESNYGVVLPKNTYEVSCDAQQISVEVKANVEYDITIDADWIKQSDTKALTSKTYIFNVDANSTYGTREGNIIITEKNSGKSEVIKVKQAQKDAIIISSKEYLVSKDAQILEIKHQTNIDFEVLVPESSQEWISFLETKTLMDGITYLQISENPTFYDRNANILFRQLKEDGIQTEISITQAQTDTLYIVEDIKEYDVHSDGKQLEVNLFHNLDYKIETESLPNWIRVDTIATDLNNSVIKINVLSSREFSSRSAQVKIMSIDDKFVETIKLNQSQRDTIIVSADNFNLSADLATIDINVKSNVEYSVVIDDLSKTWIKEKPNQSDGIYTYIIASNKVAGSEQREGVIQYVANTTSQKVKINQAKHELHKDINVITPGTLSSLISKEEIKDITSLTLKGKINGSDFRILQEMAGNDYNDKATNGLLSVLDMREVTIVAGGQSYRYESGYYTSNNVFPNNIFGECNALRKIYLPKTITSIGSFAFYWCKNLYFVEMPDTLNEIGSAVFSGAPIEKLVIPEGVKKLNGNLIWNTSSLIEITLPESLEEIDSYCINAPKLGKLTLRKNVKYIGDAALLMSGLKELHCLAIEPPVCANGSIGISKNAVLYVPKGTYAKYATIQPWSSFNTIIEE